MSHPTDDPRSSATAAGKPTLEMLLRVKQAERPDEAFWSDFDRGFRQKQLAASIEPRPWWLGLVLGGRRLAPFGLPISAGAAALVALMVLRSQAPFEAQFASDQRDDPVVASLTPVDVSAPGAAAAPVAALPTVSDFVSVSAPASVAPSATVSPQVARPARLAPSVGPASSVLASLVPGSGSPASRKSPAAPAPSVVEAAEVAVAAALLAFPSAFSTEPTPSERTIAENLAAVRAEQPALIAAVAPAFAPLDATAVAADSAAEDSAAEDAGPAEAMTSRRIDPRQARLLAMADTAAAHSSDLANVRERMVHRLAHDDTNYGSARRLGVGGDRFSLSF